MDRVYYPLTGVEGVCIAENVQDSLDGYSAGTPSRFLMVQSIGYAEERAEEDVYANNNLQDVFFGSTKGKFTMQVTGLSEEERARYLGIHYDDVHGRSYGTGKETPPYLALGFKVNKGTNDYVYMWFLKGLLTGGEVKGETKKDGVTVSTMEFTFRVLPTSYCWLIDGEYQGLTYVKGDTTSESFNPDSWFMQVQTPDTVSAPSALSMESITPNDGATSVAVGANVVITFNNKIKEDAISLFDADTDAFVAVNKQWDAAGKVCTMTPQSPMNVSTTYKPMILGVTDVYGQKLADTISTFTTEA